MKASSAQLQSCHSQRRRERHADADKAAKARLEGLIKGSSDAPVRKHAAQPPKPAEPPPVAFDKELLLRLAAQAQQNQPATDGAEAMAGVVQSSHSVHSGGGSPVEMLPCSPAAPSVVPAAILAATPSAPASQHVEPIPPAANAAAILLAQQAAAAQARAQAAAAEVPKAVLSTDKPLKGGPNATGPSRNTEKKSSEAPTPALAPALLSAAAPVPAKTATPPMAVKRTSRPIIFFAGVPSSGATSNNGGSASSSSPAPLPSAPVVHEESASKPRSISEHEPAATQSAAQAPAPPAAPLPSVAMLPAKANTAPMAVKRSNRPIIFFAGVTSSSATSSSGGSAASSCPAPSVAAPAAQEASANKPASTSERGGQTVDSHATAQDVPAQAPAQTAPTPASKVAPTPSPEARERVKDAAASRSASNSAPERIRKRRGDSHRHADRREHGGRRRGESRDPRDVERRRRRSVSADRRHRRKSRTPRRR